MTTHPIPSLLRLFSILIIGCVTALLSSTATAGKIYTGDCGKVYLKSGEVITADGDIRIRIPAKNKKLEIINKAYTKYNNILRKIEPETVDSVVVWKITAPDHPHTLLYIKKYGWCYQLEHTPYITVYSFAPKGYYCSGNGGFWMQGKSKMLVFKDGVMYDFGKPDKYVNKKFLRRLESLTSDDPSYIKYLRSAKGRADKVLRSLIKYNP